jgi:hypothetical protein
MFFWYSNILCEHGIFDDIGKENNDCVTPDHNVVFYLRYSVHCMELYIV